MKGKLTIVIASSAIVLAVLGAFSFMSSKPSMVYIETATVFDGFQLRIDLERDLKAFEKEELKSIEQLQKELETLYDKYQTDPTEALVTELRTKDNVLREQRAQLEQDLAQKQSEYHTQIWEQLNQYIKQYGDTHDHEYILGANGQGSLMYAKSSKNLTQEVLDFVNKKYDGE